MEINLVFVEQVDGEKGKIVRRVYTVTITPYNLVLAIQGKPGRVVKVTVIESIGIG